MCDYSLAHLPNRLAVEGEQLVVHRFGGGTLGLTPARPGWKQFLFKTCLAICVPPGARLRLRDIPERLQRRLGVGAVEEVLFVEQSLEAFTYRDAVRFANGQEILLQRLQCGQRVGVLNLGGMEEEIKPRRGTEMHRRVFVG